MASDAMKKICPDLIRGRNPKATLVTPIEDNLTLVHTWTPELPARNTPAMKSLVDPILAVSFPNTGTKIIWKDKSVDYFSLRFEDRTCRMKMLAKTMPDCETARPWSSASLIKIYATSNHTKTKYFLEPSREPMFVRILSATRYFDLWIWLFIYPCLNK